MVKLRAKKQQKPQSSSGAGSGGGRPTGLRLSLRQFVAEGANGYGKVCLALQRTKRRYAEIYLTSQEAACFDATLTAPQELRDVLLRLVLQVDDGATLERRLTILSQFVDRVEGFTNLQVTIELRASELDKLTGKPVQRILEKFSGRSEYIIRSDRNVKILPEYFAADVFNDHCFTLFVEGRGTGGVHNWFGEQHYIKDLDAIALLTDRQADEGGRFNSLVLVLTELCNIQCKHCAPACSPYVGERVDVDFFADVLRQCAELPEVNRECAFVGGEPTLFREEFLGLVRLATSLGFTPSMTTNGWWGRSPSKSDAFTKSLCEAGMRRIELSVDGFHQEFVSKATIRNVLSSARKFGIAVILRVATAEDCRVGESLAGFDINDLAGALIAVSPVLPLGRAEAVNPVGTDHPRNLYGKCGEAFNLTVTPQGVVSPCCVGSDMSPFLHLGNAREEKLSRIVRMPRNDFVLRGLAECGVKSFYDRLSSGNVLKLDREFVGMCHLCNAMFSDAEVCADIERDMLERLANLVAEVSL